MTTFQRPCSGFTASDLISLHAIWPEGTHESDAEGDRFLVCRPGERIPWLSIARHRDGTYLSLDLSGLVYAQGRSLADLALDGSGEGDRLGPHRLIDSAGRINWQNGR
jgi:hypothetical protein